MEKQAVPVPLPGEIGRGRSWWRAMSRFVAYGKQQASIQTLAPMNLLWYDILKKVQDDGRPNAAKIPLIFYRTVAGSEPVREWLKELAEAERHAIGRDLLRAQWQWPVGMPLCRPLGKGLWEVRTDLPTKRTARVLLCLYGERLVALHGFIKKTRATPDVDLAIARKRQKELQR